MMAQVGQRIVYRLAPSDYRSARITKIVSGTTVNLVAFTTGDEWYSGVPGDIPAYYISEVAQGTAVGTWQEATGVDPAVSSEIDSDVATEASARDVAIAAAISDEADARDAAIASAVTERCAVPGAGASVSLALNTPRQPSTTRPVLVTVYGSWSWVLSAIGSQSGAATLKSDISSTPTTPKGIATCARGISVGITVGDTGTMPWSMSYEVPPGDYYQIATTGTGTFAIDHINETTL